LRVESFHKLHSDRRRDLTGDDFEVFTKRRETEKGAVNNLYNEWNLVSYETRSEETEIEILIFEEMKICLTGVGGERRKPTLIKKCLD
jgi:hypothetical protein